MPILWIRSVGPNQYLSRTVGLIDHGTGTISPPLNELHRPGMKHYVPWVPDWLDLNVMVPLIATVIVVAVGILVICVALTRRGGDDGRNGPKDVYCRFSRTNLGTTKQSVTNKMQQSNGSSRFWLLLFCVFLRVLWLVHWFFEGLHEFWALAWLSTSYT